MPARLHTASFLCPARVTPTKRRLAWSPDAGQRTESPWSSPEAERLAARRAGWRYYASPAPLDAKRPARPAVADAAAAFASAGLDATDAVDDCLACWEFLCAFRGSAVLPLNSEAGHLMLPETRLDEFAAALQAPHAELQRRPAHANQYRYLQHLHVELLKVLFNDDGTDAWWPKPAKRHAGPESNLRLRCARIVSTRLLISVENWTRAIDSSQNQPNRLRFDRAREVRTPPRHC